ncbi:MAG: hypothetical protein GF329_08560 [Candidatus Lokiarchaeota archaeon]|nr:hypothetical protein [Candidatus Lokiarchaeota archaeon]
MIKIENINEVTQAFEDLKNACAEVRSSDGKDMVKEVQGSITDFSEPISKLAVSGETPPAVYEAIYQSFLKPTSSNKQNAGMARTYLGEEEDEIDEVVDRFVRDFIDILLRDM